MSPEENFARERFLFTSEALQDEHALHVVRFSGHEGLNELYSFELTVATTEKSLPLPLMLSKKGKFTILGNDTPDAKFSGFVTKIVQTSRYNDWTFYQLTLQPAFWYYTQTVQNNFFIGKTVQQLLDECLGKLESCNPNHEFKLDASYKAQPFSMQHNETLYDYMSWKMERDGIYYYFEEKDQGEHLVFTDSKSSHTPLDNVKSLRYSPSSGMENAHQDEVITSFSMTCSPLPQWVVLRDYNWRNPNTPVIAKELVSEQGLGEVYYYGEGYDTVSEGKRLAAIRAEALRCRAMTWNGTSAVPCLRPGRNFTLDNHYDESFNREYTITSVTHEGSQEAHLSQAIGVPIDNPDKLYYRNSFACIASDQQFRPERKTKRAKVSGMITAFIDSSSNSSVAEINDEGCYKVYFPQDDSGHGSGSASCWIRRMQPHVGQDHGFTLPLTPGVEVLVTFMDGDPDKPVIAGAVSNAETGFMENSGTSQAMGLNSPGGNSISFNDSGTKQGMVLKTGASSGIMMSAGSADAMVSYSDNCFESYSSIGSQEAGLINDTQAGFEQVLKADHGVYSDIENNIWEVINNGANACEWAKSYEELPEDATDEDKEAVTTAKNNKLDSLSYVSTGVKAIMQLRANYRRVKEQSEGKYSSALVADDDCSGLTLKTSMDSSEFGKYIGFWLNKNLGKLVTDTVAFSINEHDADIQYDKRQLGRDWTSETVGTLSAEMSAIFSTLWFRKILMGEDQPKGILVNAANGPLINKTSELSISYAKQAMLLASMASLEDSIAFTSPKALNDTLGLKDNQLEFAGLKSRTIGIDEVETFSSDTISNNAKKITLSTSKSDTYSDRLNKLSTFFASSDVINKYAEYTSTKCNSYGEITIDNNYSSNKITVKNEKGSINISNNGASSSDNLLIENKLNSNNASKIKLDSNVRISAYNGNHENYLLLDSNGKLTEKVKNIDITADESISQEAKEIEFIASGQSSKFTIKNITGTTQINGQELQLEGGFTSKTNMKLIDCTIEMKGQLCKIC